MYARHEYGLTDAGSKTSYDTLQSILGYLTIEACFVGTLSYNTFGVQPNMHEIHSTQCREGVHIVSTAAMVLASKVFRVIPINNTRIIPIPIGGINQSMTGHGRRYPRARAEISAGKDGDICGQKRRYPPADGDICGQKRRYPPAKPHDGPTG